MFSRKIPVTAIPIILVLLTTGCASLSERAQEALAAGNYEVAARYYERALARKPDDAEAASGLKQARGEILGQKLLQVRNARLAGNHAEALELLQGVVGLESQWQLVPGGKVAFTQEEEQEFAKKYFVQRIEAELAGHTPLRAAGTIRTYGKIFDAGLVSGIRNKVNKHGKDSCQLFRKEVAPGKPFFALFVANYCRFWGDTRKVGAGKAALSDVLFGKIDLKVEQGASPFEASGHLLAEVSKAFAQTPWYDPDGKLSAQASVSVAYQQQKDKQGVVLVQPYREQEYYVENVVVKKFRRVEYVENGAIKYRDDPYETVEAQKKSRTVEKQYRYPAWKHTQKLALSLAGQFQFAGRTFHVAHSEKADSEGVEHEENQPSYNLKPSRPNLPDPMQWNQQQSTRFAESFRKQAGQLWMDSYCRMDIEVDSFAESGNQVELCLRSRPAQAPKFADDWYRKFLGMSYAEAVTIIGSAI
ncbi:MAG: hypothetical protein A2X94_04610 [Bdellovibrionales bacterium GWB1_55_8]|nr:MAG: hypothetical protein A2X94_04610 [Bdellovibrionales bacterium GWB1_55_8]